MTATEPTDLAAEHTAVVTDWTALLDGELPILDLPIDRPRRTRSDQREHHAETTVSRADLAPLELLAHETDSELAVVVLAAYTIFLTRMTGQRDLIVGAAQADSTNEVWALRTVLIGSPTFYDVVRDMRASVRAAEEFGGVPLHCLIAELELAQVAGVHPVFQTTFQMPPTTGEIPVDSTADACLPDLSVRLSRTGGELLVQMVGSAQLFDESTVGRFAEMFAQLLRVLGPRRDERIDEVPLLAEPERRRILTGLNHYARPQISYTTMAQPFEEQVRRSPEAIAVVGETGTLTYAELDTRADRLARILRAHGVRPGGFVALCMERGLDLMVSFFAIAKTGAAYVPLDPDLPDARLSFMLEDSTPAVVLVDGLSRPRVPHGPWQIIAVDDPSQWQEPPPDSPDPAASGGLIYLLYTSGTTGRPKAVAYPVDGALADIFWLQRSYPFRAGDTAILKTSYAFDVSIWEIFWPLYYGARVVICPPREHLDPVRMRELIERYEVSTLFLVPSMMQPFLDSTPARTCPSLRWVFCGGEPVTARIRDGFHERFTGVLINCYGPTEAGTVTDMVLAPDHGVSSVPLGRPAANFRTYVLDENLEPMPIGVPGEVFIGGEVGLAQGYHRRAALTAERFLPDPHGAPGSRMYRTGDLCRYRDDGVLEHLGRIGRQVKVRGMRVELAEIEAVFAEHDDIARCVVAVDPDHAGQIAAFIVAQPGRSPQVPQLLEHIRQILPSHMMPANTTVVPKIPAFVSGKIDVSALLGMIEHHPRAADLSTATAPVGDLESHLADIYRRVLKLPVVDVTESFFALGGHSLLAMELLDWCAGDFGVRPTVRDLFANSSVRDLAEWLAATPQANDTNLVKLVGEPGQPPIVFVHAAGGSVLPFLPVARLLAEQFTVYGLQSLPDESADSVEGMAADYIAAVDEACGTAPVTLVGWSVGGCIAVEMARLWRRSGRSVTATVLLDTWAPPAFMRTPSAAAQVLEAIGALDALELEGLNENGVNGNDVSLLMRNTERNRNAFLRYAPTRYRGALDLLCATDPVAQPNVLFPPGYLSGDRGWSRFADALTTTQVRGSHFSVLDDAHADQLADTIVAIINSRSESASR